MEDEIYDIGDLIKFKFANIYECFGLIVDIVDEDIYLVSWQKYPHQLSTEHRKSLVLVSKMRNA